ncbi:MAG: ABC transporter permease [Pseudomonadota bacterium]
MTSPRPTPLPFTASLSALVLVWIAAAFATADPDVLPQPWTVAQIALAEWQSGELSRHIAATLRRVTLAFLAAFSLGCLLGAALGASERFDRWAGPWVVVAQNIPALVVIVLCYLWIGLNEVAAITAVAVNKTAMVAVTLREGVRNLDPATADMARAYRMDRWTQLRHVILPQLWPFLASATRNGLAIIWKIVLVVEFLGRSDGVGFRIHLFFQLFETGHVLAYALSFVGIMIAIEYVLLRPIETRATRWRKSRA